MKVARAEAARAEAAKAEAARAEMERKEVARKQRRPTHLRLTCHCGAAHVIELEVEGCSAASMIGCKARCEAVAHLPYMKFGGFNASSCCRIFVHAFDFDLVTQHRQNEIARISYAMCKGSKAGQGACGA